ETGRFVPRGMQLQRDLADPHFHSPWVRRVLVPHDRQMGRDAEKVAQRDGHSVHEARDERTQRYAFSIHRSVPRPASILPVSAVWRPVESRPSHRPRAWSWPNLLRDTLAIEVFACPRCGGQMRMILGLPIDAAPRAISEQALRPRRWRLLADDLQGEVEL